MFCTMSLSLDWDLSDIVLTIVLDYEFAGGILLIKIPFSSHHIKCIFC